MQNLEHKLRKRLEKRLIIFEIIIAVFFCCVILRLAEIMFITRGKYIDNPKVKIKEKVEIRRRLF